ncbi:MAG: hypothetical protein ACXVDZ_04125 [Bacteroidia bacterium]
MKPNIILKISLLFVGIILSFTIRAQEIKDKTYHITDNGSVKDIQPYIDALNKSNMRYHRLRNSRNTIVFNTGVTVQLFSAAEINENVHPMVLSDYPESFDSKRDVPAFYLGPNDFIIEQHHLNSKYH